MTGGFRVSPETLTEKSKEIGEISASVRECVQASDEEGVGGLVYGVIFDVAMLPVLSLSRHVMGDLMGTAADAADKIATNLDRNAKSYAGVESFLLEHFGAIQTETPGGPGGR